MTFRLSPSLQFGKLKDMGEQGLTLAKGNFSKRFKEFSSIFRGLPRTQLFGPRFPGKVVCVHGPADVQLLSGLTYLQLLVL
jgi:hypothetical protein